MEGDIYHDPFDRCTELIAIAQTFNMTVKEYLLHLNKLKEDRIKFRVWVLICLKRINDKRISDSEDVIKRRKLNDGGGSSSSSGVVLRRSARISSSSSSSGGGGGGGKQVYVLEHGLDGVLAEDKITAFALWREIVMFL